jgi:hypothetical protein
MSGDTEITNYEDMIDSRDVIERIAYLEDLPTETTADEDTNADDLITEEEQAELTKLRALAEEGESLEDWPHGATLIRDSYFKTYAEELAEETSETNDLVTQWPYRHIDWESAARELRMDYTTITFDGIDYWVR